MGRGRLEAFSDGVIAVIITIMVLEMKVPHGNDLAALVPLVPVFLSYVVSFIYVGIYWNNHHHMLHAVQHVNGRVLWANMHLLFWLSLVPFVTGWANENLQASLPVALYGVVLLMAGVSYYLLERVLIAGHGKDSSLAKAMGSDFKGLGDYGTVGLDLVLSILVGFFGGRWLDAKVGAHGWLTIIGFGFGVAAGFLSVYRAAVKMRKETEAEDERERRARKGGDHGQDDRGPT